MNILERNEQILQAINKYLMERFYYKTPPAHFGVIEQVICARRKKFDLYFRLVDISGGLWDKDTFVIAKIGFFRQRKGLGTDLLHFLTELSSSHKFKFIGIECANTDSSRFAEKFGFSVHEGYNNYIIRISDLIEYFQK